MKMLICVVHMLTSPFFYEMNREGNLSCFADSCSWMNGFRSIIKQIVLNCVHMWVETKRF